MKAKSLDMCRNSVDYFHKEVIRPGRMGHLKPWQQIVINGIDGKLAAGEMNQNIVLDKCNHKHLGLTTLLGLLGYWYLFTHPHSSVFILGITTGHGEELAKAMNRWHEFSRHKEFFKINKSGLLENVGHPYWRAIILPYTEDNLITYAGGGFGPTMLLMDEIPYPSHGLMQVFSGTTTYKNSMWVMGANYHRGFDKYQIV